MPATTSSPCDSIANEIKGLEQEKKAFQREFAKASASQKALLIQEIKKITLGIVRKRQELDKCLKKKPSEPSTDLFKVVEVRQPAITKDPAVIGKLGNNFTFRMPSRKLPQSPPQTGKGGAFELLGKMQFAPVVEARLAPSAKREVSLQISGPSILLGSVHWIGTMSPLTVNLLLDELSLSTGTIHGYLNNRGRSNLQIQTTKGGLVKLSATNTTQTAVKVKIILGALDLVH